ncbi:MAG: hypothetical protein CML17_12975 [Pusillimonas sp.]|nr:hypothetical protein [Pusillimonas sp.]
MKESLLLTVEGKTLAFGLEWLPLIDATGLKEARRRAGRYHATHFVLASDTAGAVGLANLRMQKPQGAVDRQPVFAAAQNVASLFQSGTWVVCLNLTADCWWLVAVHEGTVVMRTDVLGPSAESFNAVICELRRAYPHLTYLQSGCHNEVPDLTSLAQMCGAMSMLRRRRIFGARGKLLALAGILSMGCTTALVMGLPNTTAPHNTHEKTERDAQRRWQEAQQTALDRVYVHDVKGTQRLLEALYSVAVSPAGWQLEQVACQPRVRAWHCVARFHRSHPATDSQALETALPARWEVQADGLDRAKAAWSVPVTRLTLTQVQIPSETESRKTWLGVLQRVSMAFERIIWGQAKAVSVITPTNPEGRPIPRPRGLHLVQSRRLQLSGPLRSYALLLADLNAIRWTDARLSINRKAIPGLRTSQLHLSLEGEFHERVE